MTTTIYFIESNGKSSNVTIENEKKDNVISCLQGLGWVIVKVVDNESVEAKDARMAKCDCKNGIYDKWYRYNRKDDGAAYDKAWMEQNKETQNEKVQFIAA